jgi:hypothetical protein
MLSHNVMRDNQYTFLEMRKQKQADRENIREAVYQHKKDEMLQIKKQREINEAKKRDINSKQFFENKMRQRLIKEQQELSNLRKKEFAEAKIRQYRMEHERRMAEEEEVKQKKELEVLNMEKLEMELIRKLQHTQLLQKAAYEELESALAHPAEEYEKKFIQALNGYGSFDGPNLGRQDGGRASFSGSKSGLRRDDSFPMAQNDNKSSRNKTPTPTLKIEGSHSTIQSKSESIPGYIRKPSEDGAKSIKNPSVKEDALVINSRKETSQSEKNTLTENKSNHDSIKQESEHEANA